MILTLRYGASRSGLLNHTRSLPICSLAVNLHHEPLSQAFSTFIPVTM